jgi:hypothetical protein
MPAAIAEAPSTGIGKLLAENGFAVPTHQGNYRWKEDEVKQLFDDILEAIDRGDDSYFLGLTVFMPQTDELSIVLDGQQRLATSIMILAAVRTWLSQFTEYKEDARQIQERFIGLKELGETELKPRLHLNTANHALFERHVINERPITEIQTALSGLKRFDPNRLMLEAVVYCYARLAQIVKEAGDSKKARDGLLTFVKYLKDKVFVIRLVVSSEANAYTIFETLNDRGLELSPLDLVKNYLFGRAAAAHNTMQLRDMESRWVQMIATLANVKPGNFLKAFWTSRHGRIQKLNLFENLKKQYDSVEKAVDLSIEMLGVAEHYAALENSDDPVWTPYSGIRETVKSLKLLGAEQTHPVLLAGLAKLLPYELERQARLLEVIIVRYQLVGGGRTGRLEIACAKLAHKVFQSEVTTASAAREDLKDLYPSDDDFNITFLAKEETTNAKASYLLKRLEREARRETKGANAKELDPGAALTVEHIVPKKPTPEWIKDFASEDEAEDAIFKLGNLCLVAQNKELGRMPFKEKKPLYAKSELETTRELSECDDTWNMDTIKKRQERLAKYAVQAWRFQ